MVTPAPEATEEVNQAGWVVTLAPEAMEEVNQAGWVVTLAPEATEVIADQATSLAEAQVAQAEVT